MDIQMPVMDGVTATKIIRGILDEPARSVKILALTANVMQEDLVKYFDVGIDDYVAKPFQVDELLGKMDAVLGHSRFQNMDAIEEELNDGLGYQVAEAPAVAKPKKAAAKERPLPASVTDKDFLSQFTGGNPDRMRKYVKMFMENATRLLISMDLALQAKDYTAIKIAAHSLKPQLSYMGVKEDVSHIFMIEQSAGSSAHYDNLEDEIVALNKVCNRAFEELKHLV
jgi:CheY-like chemotaxis protein